MSTGPVSSDLEGQATGYRSETNDREQSLKSRVHEFICGSCSPNIVLLTCLITYNWVRIRSTPRDVSVDHVGSYREAQETKFRSETNDRVRLLPVKHVWVHFGILCCNPPNASSFWLWSPTTESESGPRPLMWVWVMLSGTQRYKKQSSDVNIIYLFLCIDMCLRMIMIDFSLYCMNNDMITDLLIWNSAHHSNVNRTSVVYVHMLCMWHVHTWYTKTLCDTTVCNTINK